jgi:signal transduction histidine kinase
MQKDKLYKANSTLKEMNLLMAEFFHELKNPVNFINNGVYNVIKQLDDLKEMLLEIVDESLSHSFESILNHEFEPIYRNVRIIGNGTQQIISLIEQMQDISRLTQDTLHCQQIDIVPILQSTLSMIELRYKDQVEIIYDPQCLPKIKGNLHQIGQIFLNIMLNACQSIVQRNTLEKENFMGKLEIITEVIDSHLVIHLQDNGCGIPADILPHIFEPFFTTKPKTEGCGMGLHIVQKIVEQHKGSISVSSEILEGTRFSIYLPIAFPS